MKVEDFNKTTEELKREYQKNDEQINISDERKRISSANQFEYKALTTIGFSLLPYLGLVILFGGLTKNGVISSLIGTIPVEVFPLIIAGGSLCVGTIGRKALEWRFKTKERLKAFTTANTQSEKLQEEVKYTVDLEKARNRNKAIQQAIDSLSSNQSILESLSSRYDIKDRTIPQTEEDAKKRAEDLSELLKDKHTELDILTTQKILHEKFWRVRTKGQKVMEISLAGMLGGLFIMTYGQMPLLIVSDYLASSSSISIFVPFVGGIVGFSGYMLKRNKDYINAFNHLNNELGENALSDKIKNVYEEQQDIDAKIENKIREISMVEIQLQEQKRINEAFSTDSSKKEQTMESVASKRHTAEETEKDTIFGYGQEELMPFMTEETLVGIEAGPQIEEKGPSLVLRKK